MKYISDYSGFKRKIRKFADDGGIEILLALIIIVCLTFIALFLHKGSFSALFNVAFFSVIIFTALLQAVSSLFRKRIMSWSEDDVKLEPNYMKLTKRYPTIIDAQGHRHEPLLTYDNPLPNDSGASEESHTHPTLHTGARCVRLPVLFDQWLVGKDITIADHQDQQYELPHDIQEHFDELFKSHIASNIYNQLNIRVDDWEVERDSFLMSTSRTTYFDSLVTNRAMDFQWSNGLTTRDVYQYGPFPPTLTADSPLSNHLGCNGIIVTSDKRTILIKRSKSVSIGKGTYATSVGASMKAKYALDGHQTFTLPGLKHAILCEIEDELKIPAEHITDLLFLAAYRDLVEGGKPQLAFAAYTSLTSDDVLANFNESLSRKTAAHWDKESMELEDGKTLLPIDISDLPHAVISQNAIKVRVGKQSRKLPMMPSAIATIIFFIMYLNNGGIEQC